MRALRFLSLARHVAVTSQCRYRVGAVITYGSRVLSLSPNLQKTHSLLARPAWHQKKWNAYTHTTHAEVAAILNCCSSLHGATMYVCRVGRTGKLLPSRPCSMCLNFIADSGISVVHFWSVPPDGVEPRSVLTTAAVLIKNGVVQ